MGRSVLVEGGVIDEGLMLDNVSNFEIFFIV